MVGNEKPMVECAYLSENGRSAQFVIEPLERGMGVTIGTSLRRILLSQIEGAAATAIQIDGIQHEISTIEGVVEDVTEIVLNIKSINMKLFADSAELVLRKNGAGVLTAGDIEASSDVEILNPEQHIATLNEDAKFYMTIVVNKGKGWKVSDKNKSASAPIGMIAIDSIFSPVERVNSRVENTLVGNSTDYEKLILDIDTNGAVTPEEALKEAATVLIDSFKLFVDDSEAVCAKSEAAVEEEIEKPSQEILNTTLDDLELSPRAINALKRASIYTVGELIEKDPNEVLNLPHIGKKTFENIKEKVCSFGIPYAQDIEC